MITPKAFSGLFRRLDDPNVTLKPQLQIREGTLSIRGNRYNPETKQTNLFVDILDVFPDELKGLDGYYEPGQMSTVYESIRALPEDTPLQFVKDRGGIIIKWENSPGVWLGGEWPRY